MANIHSQKKRILRSEREREENRRYTSRVRTFFHRLEAGVANGDDEAADAEHRALVSTIDKAVKRGALHRNTGARKKARDQRVSQESRSDRVRRAARQLCSVNDKDIVHADAAGDVHFLETL